MGRLNHNNFLLWDGEFNEIPAVIEAVDDEVTAPIGDGQAVISPFDNDSANFGINFESLEIISHDNPDDPPFYDAVAKTITYYYPAGATYGESHNLVYTFRDVRGNLSNEATVTINISVGETYWRGYGEPVCLTSGGDNTGIAEYAQLEEVSTALGVPVTPASLKANDPGDPDYIAGVANYTLCPIPSTLKRLYLYAGRPGYTIKRVRITHATEPTQDFTALGFTYLPSVPYQLDVLPGTDYLVVVTLTHEDSTYTTDSHIRLAPAAGGDSEQTETIYADSIGPGVDFDYAFPAVDWGTAEAGSIFIEL